MFNKSRLKKSQRKSGQDEILAGVRGLCDSSLRAIKRGSVDEFAVSAGRLRAIHSLIARTGRAYDPAFMAAHGDIPIPASIEETEMEASDVAMRVGRLCSSLTQVDNAGGNKEAEILRRHLKEIKAALASLNLED